MTTKDPTIEKLIDIILLIRKDKRHIASVELEQLSHDFRKETFLEK